MEQQALGEAGLRACTGTAGDTRSRTWRNRQAGGQSDVPDVGIVFLGALLLLADHHPAGRKRRGQQEHTLHPQDDLKRI